MSYSVLFVVLIAVTVAAQTGCDGTTPNTQPIYSRTPTFVKQIQNGKLYQVTQIQPPINVIHVYGTPYEMGLAHGQLMQTQIRDLYSLLQGFVDEQVEAVVPYLPKFLVDMITNFGVNAALDWTYWETEEYIAQYFKDEMKGLADGTGMDYMEIVRIHMIPELIKASCSMIGAWGQSIKNTNDTLVQLRALDWTTNGPFQLYPAVIVYHPNQGNGHPFSIVTWAGFIGAITGFSSAPMGLCEKVWYSYNESSSRSGIPFHFLLRDILQWDTDIDSAIGRVASAHRTCSIWIGLGDYSNQFRAIEYSLNEVAVFDDRNFPVYSGHPHFNSVVYIDKHVQPSHNPCLGSLVQKYYGSLDPVTIKQYVTAIHQTGNMHIAIYDFASNEMYVSNASPYVNKAYTPAYDRPFARFDMTALFAEPKP